MQNEKKKLLLVSNFLAKMSRKCVAAAAKTNYLRKCAHYCVHIIIQKAKRRRRGDSNIVRGVNCVRFFVEKKNCRYVEIADRMSL